MLRCLSAVCFVMVLAPWLKADDAGPVDRDAIQKGLTDLQAQITTLNDRPELQSRDGRRLVADVAVYAKAVEWALRHHEFPKPEYVKQTLAAIRSGLRRAEQLSKGTPAWVVAEGVTIRGYVSAVDQSIQPYALSLPAGVDPSASQRWPLYVHLHGRANDMNEVNFIAKHDDKPLAKNQTWIQLDVFGRGNNAYRWAGETDVLEAIADVSRRFRIDPQRVVLHGFSMGGAGAWHLGMHYPANWCSVGAGAGFVDFYKYQKQKEKLPPWQDATLGIYDTINYAENAFNVPTVTYGGENDPQLEAGRSMTETAVARGVDVKLLIGPGMGHKFDPESLKTFMEFHRENSEKGRPIGQARRRIRFTTQTLKYNRCDWVTIEEMDHLYQAASVDAQIGDDGNVVVKTQNVAILSLMREAGVYATIDGKTLPCYDAAEGLLPNVFYEKTLQGWHVLNYDESKAVGDNPHLHKRHNLQGPIDDAFMSSFVCVTGTATPQNTAHSDWVSFTLTRFQREFDQWMRAQPRMLTETQVDDDVIAGNHLILFGNPESNSVLKKVLPSLPVTWSDGQLTVAGTTYSTEDHGLSMIFPNPLNPSKYVVINSGHTFHDRDFRASNAWLFPRLGDIAVVKFSRTGHEFTEEIVYAENFNSGWRLPTASP
ncbi:MAG: prolyl oligopeptidase family serine peptidase [Planctomycetaceae bacterium]